MAESTAVLVETETVGVTQVVTSTTVLGTVTASIEVGGGGGAVDSVNGEVGVVVLSAADVSADPAGSAATAQAAAVATAAADATAKVAALSTVYQPLDSDLSAIAALTTTAYGRAFLALADAAAGRTALGLGTAATAATGDFDAAGSAAAAQAASQPVDSDLTAIAALTTTAYGRSLLAMANAAAVRTSLNVEDGATADQSAAEILAALLTVDGAGSGLDADTLDGTSSAGFATAAQGSTADTALQPADIGSTVQAYDAVLDATTASFTTADETKLGGIAAGAQVNTVDSVDGLTGAVVLSGLYGVVAPAPNGSDDTAALQALLDAATAAGGGEVTLREDASYIADGLTLGTNVTLSGRGPSSVLTLKAASANHLLTLEDNATTDVTIRDLTLNGAAGSQSGARHGIFLDHTSGSSGIIPRHRVLNVKIVDCKGNGLHLGVFTRGVVVDTVNIYDCDGDGLYLGGADSSISNVSVGQSGDDGVVVAGNAYQLTNVKAWYSGRLGANGRGFMIEGQNNQLIGCYSQENRANGFQAFRSGTVIAGLILSGCTSDGDGTIASQVGFNLFNCTGASVRGTVTKFTGALGTPASGLAIAGGSTECDVELTVNGNTGPDVTAGSTLTGNHVRINGSHWTGSLGAVELAAKQPLDADLTALAAAGNSGVLAATTASFTTADETKLDGIEAAATADQSPAEILAALLTVDGAGSGLDADLLDGNSSAAFATAAALTAHIDDTADAHDASAISVVPAGENTDDTVQESIDALFSRTARISDLDDLRVAQVFIDDFRAPNVSAGRIGETQWDDNLVGTGAVSANPLAASGTTVVLTGTALNDEAEIVAYYPVLSIGVMTMRWYIQMGPGNATQAYTAEWGWQQDDATPHGCWFRVINNIASPDPAFVCVTSDGTTEQTTTTSTLATDSTFFETEITHDGAGTYRFYVNETLVATHSTTVPGIAVMSPTAKLVKTVGSGTARSITIDYCAIRMEVNR